MKKLVVMMCLVSLAAGGAFAQADPDPDSFGVYFDMDATQPCSNVADNFHVAIGVYGDFDAYVCLTNPSCADGVAGVEFSLTQDGAAVNFAFGYSNVNPLSAPDYAAGFSVPIPFAPIVVLGTIAGSTFGESQTFSVGPITSATQSVPGNMCYVDGADAGHKIPMFPSTGSFEIPVAVWQQDECAEDSVVPSADETWGSVKALYR